MPFTKKPENLKLTKQLNCTISEDSFERWQLLCQRNQMTSHQLLRQIVEKYVQENSREQYGVLDLWKSTQK
jgi:hypothetical protein